MKKTVRVTVMITGLVLLFSGSLPAYDGGDGLIYIRSAKVLPKGHMQLYTGTRFFGKIAQFGGTGRAFTLWNVQGKSSLNFGASSHLELFVTPIFYQDTNTQKGNVLDGEGNAPDDIFLGMKVASFGPLESPFLFGGQLYARIPTAPTHNIIYEPYSAGKLEIGLTALASYYSNVMFPETGWSLHANLGYLNHNDVGVELTDNPDDPTAQTMSSDLIAGIGIRYPAGTFDFSAEINATTFINRPPETAYSREFVSYFTAGVYYTPYRWLTFSMGVDLRLASGEDLSNYAETALRPPPNADFPNYPGWRGVLGVNIRLLPISSRSSDTSYLESEAEKRQRILDQILKGQETDETADEELQRLQAERKEVENELNRLRKLLNEEKKKK
ncbi:hypothetical protein JXO52_13660 [bacterium]|nr:hypothetical protein [bacterium]